MTKRFSFVFVTLLYTGVFIYFAEIQLNSRLCGWLIQEWTSNISVTVYDDSALHSFISSWDPWHSADLHKVCTKFQLRRQIMKSANHEEWWMVTGCLAHLLNTQPLTTSLPSFVMPQLSTDSLIHTTRIYNNDIWMSVGLEKYSRMVTKRGKVVWIEGIALPKGNIGDTEDSNKYLGTTRDC